MKAEWKQIRDLIILLPSEKKKPSWITNRNLQKKIRKMDKKYPRQIKDLNDFDIRI